MGKINNLTNGIKLDEESVNIKNKIENINDSLPEVGSINLLINEEVIAKGIKQISLSSNNRTEGFFRAMTKEQYIAFSIQESKKVLTQQQIKNISRFFDDVSNGYGFVICTRYNQLIGPDKFAEYVGIEKMDSQKGEVNNNEEK